MTSEIHFPFLRAAIAAAERSARQGNHPFGAVLVVGGRIELVAENAVVTSGDCTLHAELVLVREAQRRFDRRALEVATLYASTEPCAMCSGAIYWSGIRNVVFGCSVEAMARHTTGSFVVPCRDVFSRGVHATHVVGPLLEDEAEAGHTAFWNEAARKARNLHECFQHFHEEESHGYRSQHPTQGQEEPREPDREGRGDLSREENDG